MNKAKRERVGLDPNNRFTPRIGRKSRRPLALTIRHNRRRDAIAKASRKRNRA